MESARIQMATVETQSMTGTGTTNSYNVCGGPGGAGLLHTSEQIQLVTGLNIELIGQLDGGDTGGVQY